MDAGIYSAASGSLAAQLRLDAIANNLANASTAGFKAERFLQRAAAAGTTLPPPTAVPTPISRGSLTTDFSQGPFEATGNPLDIALSGDGFLVVDGPQGARLTRHGNLAVDADGFLTAGGLKVQGDGGDIHIGNGPVAIGGDGNVESNGAPAGKLRIVTVHEPAALAREGGTTFAPGGQALTDVPAGQVQVLQGTLEGANLSPVESLVAMIDTMRGFEAYMHAAERLDQATARAISDVGRV